MSDQSIFISALEQPPGTRQAFVDQACQGDAALQRRVERLLAAHENAAADFLGEPAGRLSPTQD